MTTGNAFETGEDHSERPSSSLIDRARHLVTVEPAAFLYKMGYMFLFLTNEQYVYARILQIKTKEYATAANLMSQNDSAVIVTECGQMGEISQIESEVRHGYAVKQGIYECTL